MQARLKCTSWLATLIVAAAALCLWVPHGSGQTDKAELWRHRNLGKALFESPLGRADAPAELRKALALAANSFRDRLNYGLALIS